MHQETNAAGGPVEFATASPADPAGRVVLYARDGDGRGPLAPAGAWAFEVTGIDPAGPNPPVGELPERVTGEWCFGALWSADSPGRRLVVVPCRNGAVTDVVILQQAASGWRQVARQSGLGPDWPARIAPTLQQAALHPPQDAPPGVTGRGCRDEDEVLLACRGVWLIPPMATPPGVWGLEITDLELSAPPGDRALPEPGLMGGMWHRDPLPTGDRFAGVALVTLQAQPSDPDDLRVAVRLLHREGAQWRLVGVWPELGTDWPEVIAPTVRLLLSAHGRLIPHAAPVPGSCPDDEPRTTPPGATASGSWCPTTPARGGGEPSSPHPDHGARPADGPGSA